MNVWKSRAPDQYFGLVCHADPRADFVRIGARMGDR